MSTFLINLSNTKLHGNGSGYVEAEAYGNAEARFLKNLGSGYVLEAYIFMYIYILKYKNLFLKNSTKYYMI